MNEKNKKVTVKLFLNKDIKSRVSSVDDEALFPVYVRVTFNRKNTKFKLNAWYKDGFEDHAEHHPEFIGIKDKIEKIVRFESNAMGDKYTVAGLGKRFLTYNSSIQKLLEKVLLVNLTYLVGNVLTHNEFETWKTTSFQDKISAGFRKIHPNIPSEVSIQGLLLALLESFNNTFNKNLTVFDWLIDRKRSMFLNHLEKILAEAKRKGAKVYAFNILEIDPEHFTGNGLVVVRYIDNVCNEVLVKSIHDSLKIDKVDIDFDNQEVKVQWGK